MADLRDQLLKAGLIDKATKQRADTSARRTKKKKRKKKSAEPDEEARRREAYEDKIAAQAEQNRVRESERKAEHEAHELRNRVANLVRGGALRHLKPGSRRFCFVSRENRILWLFVTEEVAHQLELGALAIAEQPGVADEPHVLVPRATAERIQALARDALRFWNENGN